ncbi:MAG: hypothetical protein V1662_01775, partial [Candidatus Omnitrophota bacterium]
GNPFDIIEINNEMEEYYKKQRQLVFPNYSETRGLRQQIGKDGVNAIVEGNNLLVIYWAIRYRGFKEEKEYTTSYLGYCDRDILNEQKENSIVFDGMTGYLLREFASWVKDEQKKAN